MRTLVANIRAWLANSHRKHDRKLAELYTLAVMQRDCTMQLVIAVNAQTEVLKSYEETIQRMTGTTQYNANITQAFHHWLMDQGEALPGEHVSTTDARKRAN